MTGFAKKILWRRRGEHLLALFLVLVICGAIVVPAVAGRFGSVPPVTPSSLADSTGWWNVRNLEGAVLPGAVQIRTYSGRPVLYSRAERKRTGQTFQPRTPAQITELRLVRLKGEPPTAILYGPQTSAGPLAQTVELLSVGQDPTVRGLQMLLTQPGDGRSYELSSQSDLVLTPDLRAALSGVQVAAVAAIPTTWTIVDWFFVIVMALLILLMVLLLTFPVRGIGDLDRVSSQDVRSAIFETRLAVRTRWARTAISVLLALYMASTTRGVGALAIIGCATCLAALRVWQTRSDHAWVTPEFFVLNAWDRSMAIRCDHIGIVFELDKQGNTYPLRVSGTREGEQVDIYFESSSARDKFQEHLLSRAPAIPLSAADAAELDKMSAAAPHLARVLNSLRADPPSPARLEERVENILSGELELK